MLSFLNALPLAPEPDPYDYSSYGDTTMDPGATLVLVLLMMAIYAVILIVVLLVNGFSWAGLFAKAGFPKWAAFVPFYNSWIIVRIAGRPASSFWLQFIPYAGIYWAIVSVNDLAKSFGKDVAYTVGLIFVPVVFASILSYGQARYLGPAYVSPEQKMYAQQYGQQGYPAQQYPNQQGYPAQQNGEPAYAAQQYGHPMQQDYPGQTYAAQQFTAQQYPNQQYPAQQAYPAQQYPNQQGYPAQQYGQPAPTAPQDPDAQGPDGSGDAQQP